MQINSVPKIWKKKKKRFKQKKRNQQLENESQVGGKP